MSLNRTEPARLHCVIFFFDGWFNVSPTLIELSKALVDLNYDVRVYCGDSCYRPIESKVDSSLNPKVVYLPPYRHSLDYRFLRWVISILRLRSLVNLVNLFGYVSRVLASEFSINLRTSEYILIGVDTNGIVAARLLSALVKIKTTIYLSLELAENSTFVRLDKVRRWLERASYSACQAVIVQDKARLAFLYQNLGSSPSKVFILPNSSHTSNSKPARSSYLHDLIGIRRNQFDATILHAGMICDEVYSRELALAFRHLGPRFALVYHERLKRHVSEPYLSDLLSLNSSNLFLSLSPVAYDQIDNIYGSADIGVAFYRPVDSNFSEIAHASGKLSFYLKHGKPVLMNNIESLRRLNEKYGIGVVIEDLNDSRNLREGIETILSDYDAFSARAKACFDLEYDFKKMIVPMLDYLCSRHASSRLIRPL